MVIDGRRKADIRARNQANSVELKDHHGSTNEYTYHTEGKDKDDDADRFLNSYRNVK
jgi:hypothetical protein